MPQLYRSAWRLGLLAAAALMAVLPVRASAQTDMTQQQLEGIDREIKAVRDTLAQYDAGGHFLVLAVYDEDGLAVGMDMHSSDYFRRIVLGGERSPVITIAVTKQRVIDHIEARLKQGKLMPKRAVEIASKLNASSRGIATNLREQLRGLRLLRQRIALADRPKTPGETKTTDEPKTTTRPQPDRVQGGVWRLKDGYPKFKTKEECAVLNQSNMRAELDAGSGSTTLTVEHLHGGTKQVTHGFEVQASYGDLGKDTYEPGEQSTFVLEGTHSWTKDGGGYTAAYPCFEYSGGVSIVSAEPRIGARSAGDSAQLRLGRASGGPFESDKRTITFKVPAEGKEMKLGITIGPYASWVVTWVYEWAPK